MSGFNYNKWDAIVDSSDEDDASPEAAVARASKKKDENNPFPKVLIMTSKGGYPHEDDWKVANSAPMDDDFLILKHGDRAAAAVVKKYYPWFYEAYVALGHGVERADLFRYLMVHQSAGFYADVDVMPIVPVKDWLRRFGWEHGVDGFNAMNLLVVGLEFPWEGDDGEPFQLCQWCFGASCPDHPILYAAADAAVKRSKEIPFSHDNVTKRTGPIAFTAAVIDYLRAHGCGAAVDALPAAAEPRGLYVPVDATSSCGLLVLPYRAFGYHPGPFHAKIAKGKGADLVKGPDTQRLIQHEFAGSWRIIHRNPIVTHIE